MNMLASRLLTVVTRRPVADSQCGLRLMRGRALHSVEFPAGRYEARRAISSGASAPASP